MANWNWTQEELLLPGDWMSLVKGIHSQGGVVMVLGKTDSGKTSLLKLLIQYLVRRNKKVTIIDLDIGQSTLGPPATIGIGRVDQEKLKKGAIPVELMSFLGATSPEQCIDRFLERAYHLYLRAKKEQADAILIDTTGLVMGSLGVYLKCSLIKKINPSILVALQFEQELEPILRACPAGQDRQIYRIKPYQNIVVKNWVERKARRKRQFSSYFKRAEMREIDFSTIPVKASNFGLTFATEGNIIDLISQKFQLDVISAEVIESDIFLILTKTLNIPGPDVFSQIKEYFKVKQVIIIFPDWFENLLISFNNSEGLSNGLGIIWKIDFKEKKMFVYLPAFVSLADLAQIELGMLKVATDGTELTFMMPEMF